MITSLKTRRMRDNAKLKNYALRRTIILHKEDVFDKAVGFMHSPFGSSNDSRLGLSSKESSVASVDNSIQKPRLRRKGKQNSGQPAPSKELSQNDSSCSKLPASSETSILKDVKNKPQRKRVTKAPTKQKSRVQKKGKQKEDTENSINIPDFEDIDKDSFNIDYEGNKTSVICSSTPLREDQLITCTPGSNPNLQTRQLRSHVKREPCVTPLNLSHIPSDDEEEHGDIVDSMQESEDLGLVKGLANITFRRSRKTRSSKNVFSPHHYDNSCARDSRGISYKIEGSSVQDLCDHFGSLDVTGDGDASSCLPEEFMSKMNSYFQEISKNVSTSDMKFTSCVSNSVDNSHEEFNVDDKNDSDSLFSDDDSVRIHGVPQLESVEEENEDVDEDSLEKGRSQNQSFYEKLLSTSISEEVQTSPEEKVLMLCGQTEPAPFSSCISYRMMSKCIKIGEGVYGEVFSCSYQGQDVALKIIPIEGDIIVNDCPQKKFDEILPEVVIAKELSDLAEGEQNQCSNFCQVNKIKCVKGKFPQALLRQWDKYNERKPSENDRPDMFQDDQLFMVFEFVNGGQALENYTFENHNQLLSALRQVAFALAVAEEEMEFEHRDLHIGNVLVKSYPPEEMVSFCIQGQEFEFPSDGVFVTIIDFTISRLKKDGCAVFCDISTDEGLFEGTGDFQFDVYRDMRVENKNNWQLFCPRTNILWLTYLCRKLLKHSKVKDVGRDYRQSQRRLRQLVEELPEFSNCSYLCLESSVLH